MTRFARAVAFAAVALLATSSAFDAHGQERRSPPGATKSARDVFVGRWVKYGDEFFPKEIVIEPDPASSDRLLITFTLNCQRPSPACKAVKVKSYPVSPSDLPIAAVEWFTDAADNSYTVGFQIMPADSQLVKSASREVNALFRIVPSFNRTAYFAGTEPNELRYYLASQSVVTPQGTPKVAPKDLSKALPKESPKASPTALPKAPPKN
jgi:hypothetical protein